MTAILRPTARQAAASSRRAGRRAGRHGAGRGPAARQQRHWTREDTSKREQRQEVLYSKLHMGLTGREDPNVMTRDSLVMADTMAAQHGVGLRGLPGMRCGDTRRRGWEPAPPPSQKQQIEDMITRSQEARSWNMELVAEWERRMDGLPPPRAGDPVRIAPHGVLRPLCSHGGCDYDTAMAAAAGKRGVVLSRAPAEQHGRQRYLVRSAVQQESELVLMPGSALQPQLRAPWRLLVRGGQFSGAYQLCEEEMHGQPMWMAEQVGPARTVGGEPDRPVICSTGEGADARWMLARQQGGVAEIASAEPHNGEAPDRVGAWSVRMGVGERAGDTSASDTWEEDPSFGVSEALRGLYCAYPTSGVVRDADGEQALHILHFTAYGVFPIVPYEEEGSSKQEEQGVVCMLELPSAWDGTLDRESTWRWDELRGGGPGRLRRKEWTLRVAEQGEGWLMGAAVAAGGEAAMASEADRWMVGIKKAPRVGGWAGPLVPLEPDMLLHMKAPELRRIAERLGIGAGQAGADASITERSPPPELRGAIARATRAASERVAAAEDAANFVARQVRPQTSQADYTRMRDDAARIAAYRAELRRAAPGRVVLDLGTGPDCVLAHEAAAAGARWVWASEQDPAAHARAAEHIASCEVCGPVVRLLPCGVATEAGGLRPAPEVCVHDLVGDGAALSSGLAAAWRAARGALLPPRCASIPARVQTVCRVLEVPAAMPADGLTLGSVPDRWVVAPPVVVEDVDLRPGAPLHPLMSERVEETRASRECAVNAVALSARVELSEDGGNSVEAGEGHWRHRIIPLPQQGGVLCGKGDSVVVRWAVDHDGTEVQSSVVVQRILAPEVARTIEASGSASVYPGGDFPKGVLQQEYERGGVSDPLLASATRYESDAPVQEPQQKATAKSSAFWEAKFGAVEDLETESAPASARSA